MIDKPRLALATRDTAQLLADLLRRRAGYTPEWLAPERSAGHALAAVAARYLRSVLERLGQAPAKHQLAFFDLVGLRLAAAQPARLPLVFRLGEKARGGSVPARTPASAPPPPGGSRPIVFETEQGCGVTAGRLVQVFSLWPGRDEYSDHSAAVTAGAPWRPFARASRLPAPHELFVAHRTLLALAGNVELALELELTRAASQPLSLVWEYWAGDGWRGFSAGDCGRADGGDPDSTDGLTRSGRFVLRADGAAGVESSVDGVKSHWLRARLAQPLPAGAELRLPEVDRIRLSATVNRALRGRLEVSAPYAAPASVQGPWLLFWPSAPLMGGGADAGAVPPPPSPAEAQLSGRVLNSAGQPVAGATVLLSAVSGGGTLAPVTSLPTDASGEYRLHDLPADAAYVLRVVWAGVEFSGPDGGVRPKEWPSPARPRLDLTLAVDGLLPDKAFADGTALDLSKPFYPCGQQPQPGTTFYFTSAEAFSKPGARLRLYFARTRSPQDESATATAGVRTPLQHLLRWEYWNGRAWAPLQPEAHEPGSLLDLDATEIVDLTVPEDLEPCSVNDTPGLWMRVRLQSGGYGFRQEIAFRGGDGLPANSFTYVIAQPPVLAELRLGYTWQHGPFYPERVVTYNDFRYTDRSDDAVWPGNAFRPFERLSDTTPTLYLGFDKRPPVDRLGLFFDIEEQDSTPGPALAWQFWDGAQWRPLAVEDETGALRRPGLVSFLTSPDDAPLARFGTPLHWLRARLEEDGPPGEPSILAVHPNAVWASERSTLRQLPLGASRGTPGQTFTIAPAPVLPGERLEVRELAGARAQVEWRLLALELFGGDARRLAALEERLGAEAPGDELVEGPLRLRRGPRKQVLEAWVSWSERETLLGSSGADRHYTLERGRGKLRFGDGVHGRIPPAGAALMARELAAGGGSAGNLPASAVTQLLGVVPGVEAVFNPRPGEGGADGETLAAVLERAPRSLRHRGRGVTAADLETLAREASPAVAVARAVPTRRPDGLSRPGWVTLIVVPRSAERRPYPSFGLREQVRRHLESRASAELAGLGRLQVVGPAYLAVDVEATLVPQGLTAAGALEAAARGALEEFLHPLHGGPRGQGWELGRGVFLSDVAALLERLPGLDHVEDLALLRDGLAQGESVSVPSEALVAAGEIRLRLAATER